jgi:hypothetical protein
VTGEPFKVLRKCWFLRGPYKILMGSLEGPLALERWDSYLRSLGPLQHLQSLPLAVVGALATLATLLLPTLLPTPPPAVLLPSPLPFSFIERASERKRARGRERKSEEGERRNCFFLVFWGLNPFRLEVLLLHGCVRGAPVPRHQPLAVPLGVSLGFLWEQHFFV